jgi:hypothetical protein
LTINTVCTSSGTYSVVVESGDCAATTASGTYTVYSSNSVADISAISFTGTTRFSQKFDIGTNTPSQSPAGYRLIVAQEQCITTASGCPSNYGTSKLTWKPTPGADYTSIANLNFSNSTAQTVSTTTAYGGTWKTNVLFAGSYNAGINTYNISGLARNTYYCFKVWQYSSTATGGCSAYFSTNGYAKISPTSSKESIDDEPFTAQAAENFLLTEIVPNPAINDINFKVITSDKLQFTFEIYSIEGLQVYSEKRDLNEGETPVNIQLRSEKGMLPNGLYILKVRTGNDELTRRFIYMP